MKSPRATPITKANVYSKPGILLGLLFFFLPLALLSALRTLRPTKARFDFDNPEEGDPKHNLMARDGFISQQYYPAAFPNPWPLSKATAANSHTISADCQILQTADFDGDGIDDMSTLFGIIRGNQTDLRDPSLSTLSCEALSQFPTGISISCPNPEKEPVTIMPGDINHDGKPDFATSTVIAQTFPPYDPRRLCTRVYVYANTPKTVISESNITLKDVTTTPDGFRFDAACYLQGKVVVMEAGQVTAIGDINGDQYDDVGVSVLRQTIDYSSGSPSITLSTRYYVLYGNSSFPFSTMNFDELDGKNGCVITLPSLISGEGWPAIGDINGDGFDDLRIADLVFFGKSDFCKAGTISITSDNPPPPDTLSLQLLCPYISGSLSVSTCIFPATSPHGVDINGDGIKDLIIGLPLLKGGQNEQAGALLLVYGRQTLWTPVPTILHLNDLDGKTGCIYPGDSASEMLGCMTFELGDFNGDGFNDFGASFCSGSLQSQKIFVIAGGPTCTLKNSRGGIVPLSSLDGINGFQIVVDTSSESSMARPVTFRNKKTSGKNNLVLYLPSSTNQLVIFGDTSLSSFTNQLTVKQRQPCALVSTEELDATHPVINDTHISYLLSSEKYGFFATNSSRSTPVTTIWKTQEEKHGIWYCYQGTGELPGYNVSVSDGITTTFSYRANITFIPDKKPYIAHHMKNQAASEGKPFAFVYNLKWMIDPDGDRLTFCATQTNGETLPLFLTFNNATGKFSGKAPYHSKDYDIAITGSDPFGGNATDHFIFSVTPQSTSKALFDTLLEQKVALAIIGGVISGGIGIAFWKYKQNLTDKESRKICMFGNFLYQALKLKRYRNFTTTDGKRFLELAQQLLADLNNALSIDIDTLPDHLSNTLAQNTAQAIFHILDPEKKNQKLCKTSLISVDTISLNLNDIVAETVRIYNRRSILIPTSPQRSEPRFFRCCRPSPQTEDTLPLLDPTDDSSLAGGVILESDQESAQGASLENSA